MMTTSEEQIKIHFESVCTRYGFQQGSPEFNQCVATEIRSAKHRAADEFSAALNQPTYTSCNTVGNHTNCWSY